MDVHAGIGGFRRASYGEFRASVGSVGPYDALAHRRAGAGADLLLNQDSPHGRSCSVQRLQIHQQLDHVPRWQRLGWPCESQVLRSGRECGPGRSDYPENEGLRSYQGQRSYFHDENKFTCRT